MTRFLGEFWGLGWPGETGVHVMEVLCTKGYQPGLLLDVVVINMKSSLLDRDNNPKRTRRQIFFELHRDN
eukprot:g51997.t1